ELANGLEKLKKDFPDEVEAKAFLAFQIYDNSSRSLAITNNEAMDALLREVLKAEPMHPVHHARIHFWDSRKAENALPDAAACGQSAPSVAHMWHMPGHIYDKLKRYPDAVWQMEASARTDHAFMLRDHVLPDQIHNYAHNNEWLTRNLSNIGRMRDAVDLARNMIELPRHPKFNTFEKGSTYYGRTRLGDILNSWEMWNETLALADTIYLEADGSAADRAKRLRLIGLANFHKGNTAQGEQQISALEAMLKDDAKPPGDSKNSAPPSNRQPVENALAEVRLVRALESKQLKAAQEQFAKVKDLSKERQAQYQFAFGEKDKALQLAREAVQAGTNQVRVLANYTDLLYRAGKWKDAYDNFLRLRELASQADIDAPVLQRLAPVAKDLKFGANWRPPLKKPDDVGARPALDKLGPFRWHPWQAADWSLATGDGRTLSLKSYRGRPVIVIFYLGHGCAHCIEQLNAFAPLAQEFADAGISLVAVSTDSVDGLSKTHEKAKQAGGFPFPLVSDQSLKIFKAYRAFDDFENQPLHGSFLVDGDGFVRWQDISYQPFMETKFLLDEAKRLLKEPRTRVLAGQPMRVTSKPTDAACK
ncbi:MAG: redoxin domain-containing protein, partial [Verrucomicrobia bacterium]|nr:redoxin domain-containing protein [Verrucomicrobiota bacterium]